MIPVLSWDSGNSCHCLTNRWGDHLQTHGAVPGTLERRKVFHDQLPPGPARQPLSALHRCGDSAAFTWWWWRVFFVFVILNQLVFRSGAYYLWVHCHYAWREDPLCWGDRNGCRQFPVLLSPWKVWSKLPGKADRYRDAPQAAGTCDVCGHTRHHWEPEAAGER